MARLTIRKHYYFSQGTDHRLNGELVGPIAWDALRTDQSQPAFAVPQMQEAWRGSCRQPELIERGAAIGDLAIELGASAIASFGVGTACLEYQISRAHPRLQLHLSDFGAETVRRLREVFPEAASITVVDLLHDELPPIDGALTLLYRIDSEFTNEELENVLTRLHEAGHRLILLVPSGFLTPRELVAELWRRFRARTGRPATFAGYVRTRSLYDSYWARRYHVRSEGLLGSRPYILLQSEEDEVTTPAPLPQR